MDDWLPPIVSSTPLTNSNLNRRSVNAGVIQTQLSHEVQDFIAVRRHTDLCHCIGVLSQDASALRNGIKLAGRANQRDLPFAQIPDWGYQFRLAL